MVKDSPERREGVFCGQPYRRERAQEHQGRQALLPDARLLPVGHVERFNSRRSGREDRKFQSEVKKKQNWTDDFGRGDFQQPRVTCRLFLLATHNRGKKNKTKQKNVLMGVLFSKVVKV